MRPGRSKSIRKTPLNPEALNQLLGQMVNDLGAAVSGALIVLGDGLGIYAAMATSARQPHRTWPRRLASMSDNCANG
jgi:hypothetical protein